ncbi:MAG TPA: hypothetical protein VGF86_15080 [Candidatus Tumulicola sp.]
MYITDFENNVVNVYSYPAGKLVGSIGGFEGPEGACADPSGNVWIADQDHFQIHEFAHGVTKPLTTLTLQNQLVDGCSVDPSSGALAVDSYCQVSAYSCIGNGSVFLYANITDQPKQYSVLNAANVYFSGFDSKGNLFVDAFETPGAGPFELAELQKGSSNFESISVDRHIYFPGGVQWDGTYLAVGDQQAGNELTSSVHQIAINGRTGTVVSTTKLQGVEDVVQFWIQGSTLVVPNIGLRAADARLYKYPTGGSPTVIASGFGEPLGSAVSLAATKRDARK